MFDYANTKKPEILLATPIVADVAYYARREITKRRIRIEAITMLPSGGYGIRAHCFLRDQERNFVIQNIEKISVVEPSHLAWVTTSENLFSAIGDELSRLDALLIEDKISKIDDDPRLVILAAIASASLDGIGAEDHQITQDYIYRRISTFMVRTVRWVDDVTSPRTKVRGF
jgi:hypothetical protein